ncbi:MAG TPA: hypothetical protein PKH02_12765 [Bacteroidales bacterium]|nr:hypothetical protein [Bacteroidales bacterium]HPT22835.1 hypothetical protein [Bacteroidales bacterium]
MKKKALIGLVLMLSAVVTGQRPYPTMEDVQKFKKSTTCVVLEDNDFSFFNPEIKAAIEKNWTVTPYKFITTAEFDELWGNPDYSFLVLTVSNFSNDKSGSSYNYLNLLLGARVINIDKLPEFCTVPLSTVGGDEEDYTYKIDLVVRFIQHHAKTLVETPSNQALKYLKFYNKNIPEIKKKTILITAGDIDPEINTEEKIKKYYQYPVKIVEDDEIVKAVEEKRPDVLICHKVGPVEGKHTGTCIKMLIGTDDAIMYYYDTHMVDDKNANGMLASDFKRIGR